VKELDWLAAYRINPFEVAIFNAAMYVIFHILGFSIESNVTIFIINNLFDPFVHSNLKVKLGPLSWIILTPQVHHWHHSTERQAWSKNFAGRFPILDIIFGTFYMPKDRMSTTFGIDDPVPISYIKQTAYPFMPKAKTPTAIVAVESQASD
jgi:sterol desaturase/sphingolipid hydroxylase (fatty acid hydroxylase superfamily)